MKKETKPQMMDYLARIKVEGANIPIAIQERLDLSRVILGRASL